jgi:Ca2+-binding EF-hand superfamily protein
VWCFLLAGNGILEREELKQGLARLGWSGDDLVVQKMMAEADMDGNVGIDVHEFTACVMRVTVEETGTLSAPKSKKR